MSSLNPYQPREDGLPPEKVRFTEMRAEPWPDQSRRIHIHLQITPFLERPDIEVTIVGPDGKKVSSIDIIETIEERMTFTMHLKEDQAFGKFHAEASLSYPENGIVDKKKISFEIPEQPA